MRQNCVKNDKVQITLCQIEHYVKNAYVFKVSAKI